MSNFKHGDDNIASLHWSNGDEVDLSNSDYCDNITVVMEYGQMSEVPWFALWKDGQIISKHNAFLVESVVLKARETKGRECE